MSEVPKGTDITKGKEVPRDRLVKEVRTVGKGILEARGRQLRALSDTDRAAAFSEDPANADLHTIYTLAHEQPVDYTNGGELKGMKASSSEDPRPVEVMIGEQKYKVLYVQKFDGQNFHVIVETRGGGQTPATVSQAELVRGQLVAVGDRLLASNALSDVQKSLLKVFIEDAKGMKGAFADSNLSEAITRAAQEAGMVTVDDLRALVVTHFPETDQQGNPITLSEEQVAQRQKALDFLEGRNLVDLETMKVVFEGLGYKGDFFAPNGRLARYFQDIEQGNIDSQTGKQFVEAMRSGDVAQIEASVPESDEARAERERQEARAKMPQGERIIADEIKKLGGEGGGLGEIEQMRARIQELREKVKTKQTTPEEKAQLEKDVADLAQIEGQLPEYEGLLVELRALVKPTGEGRNLFTYIALKRLAEVKGIANVEGLTRVLIDTGDKMPAEVKKFVDFALASRTLTREEIIDIQTRGLPAIEDFIKKGRVLADENLKHYFFGEKDMTNEQVMELLKNAGLTEEEKAFFEKYGKEMKSGFWMLLLLLLKGSKSVFEEMTVGTK